MKTPRIEEIKSEFKMFVPEDDGSAMDWLENTLAQAHQAGREEAVEVVKSKLEDWANIEHERWSRWQSYLHSKCVEHSDGKGEWVCFPAELFRRWERQINTPYAELSEAEKESDREQVRPYIDDTIKALQDK